jgi:hypothetical protein
MPAIPRTSLVLVAGFLLLACEDTGGLSAVPPTIEPVRVTGTNLVDGELREPELRVRFDRPLLPISVLRQSLVVVTNDNRSVEPPVIRYDPVLREIAVASPFPPGKEWLTEGGYYRLVLGVPEQGATVGGVRAVDGGTLARNATRTFGFVVRAAPTPTTATDYCRDVQPWLTARCGSCHGANDGVLGLDVTSPAGLKRTAIGVVARQTAQGPTVGGTEPSALVLAQDLPRIAPGDPSRSYLIYKAFLGEQPRAASAPLACPATPFSEAERGGPLADRDRRVLADRIPGGAMPLTGPGATRDELLHLSRWIAAGAVLPTSCDACR